MLRKVTDPDPSLPGPESHFQISGKFYQTLVQAAVYQQLHQATNISRKFNDKYMYVTDMGSFNDVVTSLVPGIHVRVDGDAVVGGVSQLVFTDRGTVATQRRHVSVATQRQTSVSQHNENTSVSQHNGNTSVLHRRRESRR